MVISRLLGFILLAVAIYVFFKSMQGLFFSAKTPVGHRTRSVKGGEMIQDPMCGVYIPKVKAIEGRVKGETHFFCSPQCLEQYRASASRGNG
jgi:YHS domain-containing protein